MQKVQVLFDGVYYWKLEKNIKFAKQSRIQRLKEVSQTVKVLVFPVICLKFRHLQVSALRDSVQMRENTDQNNSK